MGKRNVDEKTAKLIMALKVGGYKIAEIMEETGLAKTTITRIIKCGGDLEKYKEYQQSIKERYQQSPQQEEMQIEQKPAESEVAIIKAMQRDIFEIKKCIKEDNTMLKAQAQKMVDTLNRLDGRNQAIAEVLVKIAEEWKINI